MLLQVRVSGTLRELNDSQLQVRCCNHWATCLHVYPVWDWRWRWTPEDEFVTADPLFGTGTVGKLCSTCSTCHRAACAGNSITTTNAPILFIPRFFVSLHVLCKILTSPAHRSGVWVRSTLVIQGWYCTSYLDVHSSVDFHSSLGVNNKKQM